MKENLSRRSFLKGGALFGAAAVATTGLAACSQGSAAGTTAQEAPADGAITIKDGKPSFLDAPAEIKSSDIKETLDADVVVVGLGIAGIAAARSAAENGAKVIAVEKCPQVSYRSSQYAYFNTENARRMGIEDIEPTELVNELMQQTGHRADARVLKNWADHAGEAFDWWAAGLPELLWQYPGGETYNKETQVFVAPTTFKPYDPFVDHEHVISGTLSVRSNDATGGQGPLVKANWAKCEELGVQGIFDSPARQLVKEGDKVVGVIVQNLDDESYTQINASKAIILSTGGYVRNEEMLQYYIPWVYDLKDKFTFTYPHIDKNGDWADMGDGQKMGYWVGGHIEEGPHCAMCHGDLGKLGIDAFLQLNANGMRFINEDLTNDHFGSALLRQPGYVTYQIFDADFPNQVGAMQGGLGSKPKVTQEEIDTVNDWTSAQGNSIDELIANLNLEPDVAATMKDQINRYNELCAVGKDEDFGKSPTRMFALQNPPFYCIRYAVGETAASSESQNALRCLVTMSGLATNANAQVLAEGTLQPIEGLYAVGNTQGGRFLGDYPATIAGASHSMAMTYGYMTGKFVTK